MVQHIHEGTSVPSRIPEYIGQEYFDQSTKTFYKAIGLTASDWQEIGAGGGGSAGGENLFTSNLVSDSIEGPGTYPIQTSDHIVSLGFGGPGSKNVTLPTGLDLNKAHTYFVLGRNTEGSSISVIIGNGVNVAWANATLPVFPTNGDLVSVKLTTIDGGNQWYGDVTTFT